MPEDPETDVPPRRRRRRGTVEAGPQHIEQPASRLHRRLFEPTRVVSDDELESIHEASLTVLRDIGIDVLNDDARKRLVAEGATAQENRIRFDPEMVLDFIASAPTEFTLHARNDGPQCFSRR